MNRIKKKKTNTFLLLEILVAIALFTLFIIPTISFPMKHVQKELKEISRIQLSLKAEEILFSIEERLHTGELSWELLVTGLNEKKQLLEVQKKIKLLEDKNQQWIEAHIFLKSTKISEENPQNAQGTTTFSVDFINPKTKKRLYSAHKTFFIAKKTLQSQFPKEKI